MPDPGPVGAVTQTVNEGFQKQIDQAAGINVAMTSVVIPKFPESNIKAAAQDLMQAQAGVLGAPSAPTQTVYTKVATALVSPDPKQVTTAQDQLITLNASNQAIKDAVKDALAKQSAQIQTLKDQHAIDLANAQAVADQRVKEIVSYVFFGASALCVIGALAVALLASAYPLFGPRAALGLGFAAVCFGVGGVGIIKLLDTKVIYWALGAGVIGIIVALVLIFANHSHAQTTANAPVKT